MVDQRDDPGKSTQSKSSNNPAGISDASESEPALKRLMDGTGSMWKAAISLLSSWYGTGEDHSNTPHIDL